MMVHVTSVLALLNLESSDLERARQATIAPLPQARPCGPASSAMVRSAITSSALP